MVAEHATVFLEQQFSGMLAGFHAHLMTPCIKSVTEREAPRLPAGKATRHHLRGLAMQLKDKVIIITGGCQGLGRAMAEYLADKGVKLALVDLNQEKLDEAVAACKAQGVEARAYLCNVANEEQVTQTVAQIAEDFGAINGLTIKVKDGEITKLSLAQWQSVIDVNLTGVFLCTREVAAKMIELKNEGAIINISSISRAGNIGQANYSAAKAGVAADTVVWDKELARYGIRVAGVAPGFIETEMVASMKPE